MFPHLYLYFYYQNEYYEMMINKLFLFIFRGSVSFWVYCSIVFLISNTPMLEFMKYQNINIIVCQQVSTAIFQAFTIQILSVNVKNTKCN